MNVDLFISSEDGKKLFRPAVVNNIELTLERRSPPGRLTFDVIPDNILNFSEGSAVRFSVDGYDLFFGFVFSQKRAKDGVISVTAYDQLRYLNNKDTYVYSGKTASQLVAMIAADLISIFNSADYSRLADFSLSVCIHFLKIAGSNFSVDDMKTRLANGYKSYLDKGGISVKNDKLKNAVNAGIKQLRAYSQTASELKLTAKKLYEIADCALRLSTEETLAQNLRKKETPDKIISNEPLQMSANV